MKLVADQGNFSLRRALLVPVVYAVCYGLCKAAGSAAVLLAFVAATAASGVLILADRRSLYHILWSFAGAMIGLSYWRGFIGHFEVRDGNYTLQTVVPAKV